MIWNGIKLNLLGYVLLFSAVLLGFSLWQFLTNWHDFKGLYLTDLSQLKATQGSVIQSYVYTSQGRRGRTSYHCQITYAYLVDGTPFQSDEVTFGNNYTGSLERTERCLAQYPMNAMVTVYYDPKDPAFAVLEPQGHDDFTAEWFFLSLSIIGFILSGVLVAWKWHKQNIGSINRR